MTAIVSRDSQSQSQQQSIFLLVSKISKQTFTWTTLSPGAAWSRRTFTSSPHTNTGYTGRPECG